MSLPALRRSLDVIVPTFRRARSLAQTLASLFAARVPPELDIHITVVQNDDDPATRAVIERFVTEHPLRIAHLCEAKSGKSHALNAGIAATTADLVGIIDDDEEIGAGWYEAVAAAFANPAVDFIGGPCLPRWGCVPPGWMPMSWTGVIGFVDSGDRELAFGSDVGGMLMGGNAVMRRELLQRVGLYSPALGPRATRRLFSCEDEDLYQRLLAAGARGRYVPALRVYHFVPPDRLTKAYYRSWSFWNGVAKSVLEAARPSPVKRIGRVPRYLVGAAVRSMMRAVRALRTDPVIAFEGQLTVLHLIGFVYGSYLYREER